MKNLLYLFSILLFFSCSSKQTIFDPVSKKEINVFESEEISFYYPKSWRVYKITLKESDIIFSVAPSKEIKDQVQFPAHFTPRRKRELIRQLQKTVDVSEHAKVSRVHFTITSEILESEFENLEDFIDNEKSIFKNDDSKQKSRKRECQTTKANERHFIEKVKITSNKYPSEKHNLLIHYHLENRKIYRLAYSVPYEYYHKYLEDVGYMFDNFEFKDEKTDLKSDLALEKQLLLKEP